MYELEDTALLQEYVKHDSEEAFATLVARHINKVYSIALRQTRNPHQAEEIVQVVFVILAKKSRQLSPAVILSGWLCRTAQLTATTFIRGEIRRVRREQEAHMQVLLNEAESNVWPQIAPLLDAAMSGLSEAEHHAVVLRFYDGKSMSEVGATMGASEDTAKKRVNRAVEKLRVFFTKRGLTVPSAVLTAALSANSVQAAPVSLAKTVSVVAATKGASVVGSTATLIKGTMKLMTLAKVKTAIIAGIVILAAIGSSTIALQHFGSKPLKPATDVFAPFTKTPTGILSLDACRFIKSLKVQGRLPGIATNIPVGIEIPWVRYYSIDGTPHFTNPNLNYPISLKMTVHAYSFSVLYFYNITKTSETNEWQLHKAWCSDTNGIVLKDFPVP